MDADELSQLYIRIERCRLGVDAVLATAQRLISETLQALAAQSPPTRSEVSGLLCSADVVWDQDDECDAGQEEVVDRRAAMDELTAEAQKLGLYDVVASRSDAPEANPVDSSTFIPEEQREIIDRCGE